MQFVGNVCFGLLSSLSLALIQEKNSRKFRKRKKIKLLISHVRMMSELTS